MKDDRPSSEASHQEGSTPKDVEARAATIAAALAAAAERMVPIAGTGIPVVQSSPHQEEAQGSTEVVSQIESGFQNHHPIDAKEQHR